MTFPSAERMPHELRPFLRDGLSQQDRGYTDDISKGGAPGGRIIAKRAVRSLHHRYTSSFERATKQPE